MMGYMAVILEKDLKRGHDALVQWRAAARELADMALAAVRRLSLREEAFSVYLSGSVLLKSERVRQDFERRLIAACPLAAVRPAEKDAAWGAVHLALRHLRA